MKTIKKLGIILPNLCCGELSGSVSIGVNGVILTIEF